MMSKRAPQARAPAPSAKRRRPYDDEDDAATTATTTTINTNNNNNNELSDSELSDLEDEEDEDEDEEDEEEDFDESTPAEHTAPDDDDVETDDESSDPDTPDGEPEESYLSDGQPDISDEYDDSDMKTRQPAKSVAQRAVARGGGAGAAGRRSAAASKPTAVTKKPTAKKVGKRAETVSPPQKLRQLPPRNAQTRSAARIGTRSSYQQQGTQAAPKTPAKPTIRLKIGKDRLREATSAWTPPPGATDTVATSTAAATNPASLAAHRSITSAPRGRKIVQEDTDEDSEEDDDSKMDDEEQPEDPEDELGDEDAEGETDDELMDSDDEIGNTPGTEFMSRTSTPDMSRLTNRQRTRMGDITTADLLELPSGFEKPGSNKAITLSAHEQELKRAEMARRRKNLTDQKLEEEKIDTINRLLKKQTPKMRGKGRATGDATPADDGGADQQPTPNMARWVCNKDGIRLAIPDTWIAAPLGRSFEPQGETESMRQVKRKLIEEL